MNLLLLLLPLPRVSTTLPHVSAPAVRRVHRDTVVAVDILGTLEMVRLPLSEYRGFHSEELGRSWICKE